MKQNLNCLSKPATYEYNWVCSSVIWKCLRRTPFFNHTERSSLAAPCQRVEYIHPKLELCLRVDANLFLLMLSVLTLQSTMYTNLVAWFKMTFDRTGFTWVEVEYKVARKPFTKSKMHEKGLKKKNLDTKSTDDAWGYSRSNSVKGDVSGCYASTFQKMHGCYISVHPKFQVCLRLKANLFVALQDSVLYKEIALLPVHYLTFDKLVCMQNSDKSWIQKVWT